MKKKILIADDEKHIIELVKLSLGDSYEFIEAYDGEQVFDALEAKRADLLILDIMMPNMDGYQVLSRLKQDNNYHNVPVIFLTAKGGYNDKMKALARGASADYITKPFEPDYLKKRVEAIIDSI